MQQLLSLHLWLGNKARKLLLLEVSLIYMKLPQGEYWFGTHLWAADSSWGSPRCHCRLVWVYFLYERLPSHCGLQKSFFFSIAKRVTTMFRLNFATFNYTHVDILLSYPMTQSGRGFDKQQTETEVPRNKICGWENHNKRVWSRHFNLKYLEERRLRDKVVIRLFSKKTNKF